MMQRVFREDEPGWWDADRKSIVITELVEYIVEQVRRQFPGATIRTEYDEEITVSLLPSFERALLELIENAAKHGGDDPRVTVAVEIVPNGVVIQIADTGPGLGNSEIDVLQTGTETPLTHGSGLGLWLAHWIVTSHDGSVDAAVTAEGTTMTISIPRTPNPSVHQPITALMRARDQFEAAFEEASDAMLMINDDARMIQANPEAKTIYGVDRNALLGKPIQQFLPDEFDFEEAWDAFQDVQKERETVTIVGGDGVERQVEYTATTDIVPGQHLVISREISQEV